MMMSIAKLQLFVMFKRCENGVVILVTLQKKSDNNDKYIVAVGWARKIIVYPDVKDKPIQSPRNFAVNTKNRVFNLFLPFFILGKP